MNRSNVHDAEKRLDDTIKHLKQQLSDLREEDRHIADRIRRLTETVDELEEEYDKHLSWCSSPGLSYSENGLPTEMFAPAVTDSIVKAASASKLAYFSGSSVENGIDRDDRGGSPVSPAPRRSVVSLSEHSMSSNSSLTKSKSGDFTLSGRIWADKDMEANERPYISSRKWSTNVASRSNRAASPSANDYAIRAPVRLTPTEPRRDPVGSLNSGQSFKKRHSFDMLVSQDTDGQTCRLPQSSTQSCTLPRQIVFRGESEPWGIPDIVCTPEPVTSNRGLLADKEEFYEPRSVSAQEGMSGLSPELSVPLMRSASTGIVSPLEYFGTNSLPRGRPPLSDEMGKKKASRINELRLGQSRVCQSLPRGMNPKMLKMYGSHSANSQPNPVLQEDEKNGYNQRSKSYEDLDQINDDPEPTRMSKRWKLPFFNWRSRDRQSSGKPS
jgi:hypothetical protein